MCGFFRLVDLKKKNGILNYSVYNIVDSLETSMSPGPLTCCRIQLLRALNLFEETFQEPHTYDEKGIKITDINYISANLFVVRLF